MISYGGYNFPSPLPFVAEALTPIVYSGSLDHFSNSITLIGEITGCDIPTLKTKKNELIFALSSGFQPLTIGRTGYAFAKPISINFADSDLRKRVPYEISFECQSELDFSSFYGIKDPVDTWEFSEEDDRIVRVTHQVSASAVKSTTGDSLDLARSFVNSRLNGVNESITLFFTGQTLLLNSKNESINRIANSYGITEEWSLSRSFNGFDTPQSIVRADSSISYSPDSFSLSVQGTIKGGISGVVDSGHFTADNATEFAKNAVFRSKTPYEESLYGDVLKKPLQYKYSFDSGSNSISFDFTFADPLDTRTGDVIHNYSTSISSSKDDPFSSVAINGSVLYNTNTNLFSTNVPESEIRWQKVEEFFSGINPFPIAKQHFDWFKINPYNQSDLNDSFISFDINKTPFDSKIEYNYSYSNKPDFFSGMLKDVSVTIETSYPIPSFSIETTTDGSFGVQETFNTIERKNIDLSAKIASGVNFNAALAYVDSWVLQYSGAGAVLIDSSLQTGSNSFSLTKSFALE